MVRLHHLHRDALLQHVDRGVLLLHRPVHHERLLVRGKIHEDSTRRRVVGGQVNPLPRNRKRMNYLTRVFSHVSGITVLAVPAEVYKYGATYGLMFISMTINCILASYVFIPVFYKLQVTSMYQYIEMRFNAKLRKFASLLYAIQTMIFLPVVIYIPALAFSQGKGYFVRNSCLTYLNLSTATVFFEETARTYSRTYYFVIF